MIIDVTRLVDRALKGRRPTGVDRVCLAYIEHFSRDPQRVCQAMIRFGGRWVIPSVAQSQILFQALLATVPPAATLRWVVVRAYVTAWAKPRSTLLLNAGHSGLDDPAYGRTIKRRGWQALYFLHDLIPLSHPEYCRAGEAAKHEQRLLTMVETGSGIIVNSAATNRMLHAWASENQRVLPPTTVALLAAAPLSAVADSAPLSAVAHTGLFPFGEPYFVVLGTLEPRKNHLLLLHLWRQMAVDLGAACPRLVVIGQRGWDCEQVVDMLDRCSALRGVVLEKPGCSDGDLALYLRHARALLFPSFEEGYGMPLVEALVAGLPVLASTLPVFHEIAGTIPEYLDPLDGVGWRRAIVDYCDRENPRRMAQLQRLVGYRPPTWPQHFAGVDDFLGKIAPL